MTRQLILSTRGSQKIHKTFGTPPCTFKQLWHNVTAVGKRCVGQRSSVRHCTALFCALCSSLCSAVQYLSTAKWGQCSEPLTARKYSPLLALVLPVVCSTLYTLQHCTVMHCAVYSTVLYCTIHCRYYTTVLYIYPGVHSYLLDGCSTEWCVVYWLQCSREGYSGVGCSMVTTSYIIHKISIFLSPYVCQAHATPLDFKS